MERVEEKKLNDCELKVFLLISDKRLFKIIIHVEIRQICNVRKLVTTKFISLLPSRRNELTIICTMTLQTRKSVNNKYY